MKQSPPFDQTELERVGRMWQEILNLQHWTLRFALVDPTVMAADGFQMGECRQSMEYHDATIRIADPQLVRFDLEEYHVPYHPERTVIHELLHLHTRLARTQWEACRDFLPLPLYEQLDSVSGLADERAINVLARSLYRLKYPQRSD